MKTQEKETNPTFSKEEREVHGKKYEKHSVPNINNPGHFDKV